MAYLLVTLVGILAGSISIYFVLESRRRKTEETSARTAQERKQIETDRELHEVAVREFRRQKASFEEILGENQALKADIRNIDVVLRKVETDRNSDRESHRNIRDRAHELATRFLKDNVKWIGNSLNANNFVTCKQRLLKVIEWCREVGLDVSAIEEASFIEDLKREFERMVRASIEKEEQARIKARIREEEKLKSEIDREMKRVERERATIQAALDKAIASARDEFDQQVDDLRKRLADAESRQRALSQAQLTKAGFIYIVSNIGSFGEGVFKVGMTRRLDPMDRVRELGDASVPFPFDVHLLVSAEDAPMLENELHRVLHTKRINRVNPRKEFFKADLDEIIAVVKKYRGEVSYVADAEALQYQQSLTISDEDLEYIERVYDSAEDDGDPGPVDA